MKQVPVKLDGGKIPCGKELGLGICLISLEVFFFFSVGGTYFPFTVLPSHKNSVDLLYTSMLVNTVQKRAS